MAWRLTHRSDGEDTEGKRDELQQRKRGWDAQACDKNENGEAALARTKCNAASSR